MGINELIDNSKDDFKLSPNPATNQLTIHTSSFHANEAVTISVMDVMGRRALPFVNLTPSPSPAGEGSAQIDVSTYASGIYFVEVVGEKERWVGKFVKQ